MKISFFWDVLPYSLIGRYKRFGGIKSGYTNDESSRFLKHWYHPFIMQLERAVFSKMFVTFYQTTWLHISENSIHLFNTFHSALELAIALVATANCYLLQQTAVCLLLA
jgi:hypothetical protein